MHGKNKSGELDKGWGDKRFTEGERERVRVLKDLCGGSAECGMRKSLWLSQLWSCDHEVLRLSDDIT